MEELIRLLKHIDTEQVNPNTVDIDRLSPIEIAKKINAEDKIVADVVELALEPISRAAEIYAETLRRGGRVFYIGAGTSGRLGVLDAAECPPTFGTDPDQIIGLISGGYATLVLSMEGVEDDCAAAVSDLKERDLKNADFLIGLAASSRTPYTLAGLEYARSIGCKTALIACNRNVKLDTMPDIMIELPVGPEAITGSTRMKSGTVQKMTLNMISTTAMVLLGKTYGNLMIDLQSRSDKLAARSRQILMELLEIDLDVAEELLNRSDGSVKLAIAMHWLKCDADEAQNRLSDADGFLSRLGS
ncbi:MAG: N-acetylmuramic acid 6-phosphate etherase [candidate division Zixibacteria bacterium]|nr:N-acetylmuramic acid 6-phosphate etherase [candidate division Zixibacteria bacterium]